MPLYSKNMTHPTPLPLSPVQCLGVTYFHKGGVEGQVMTYMLHPTVKGGVAGSSGLNSQPLGLG